MKVSRVLLVVLAAGFLIFGIAYAGWPAAMVRDVGIRADGARGLIDLRVVYGGMQLGVAAFLIYCLLDAGRIRLGLVASFVILVGMAGTRLVGMIQAGEGSRIMWLLLASEAVGVPVAIAGLISLKRDRARA